MLSVLIETKNDEEGLARTLAGLVPAAVEGVVREVIVCDRGSTDKTHLLAEHAGCRFVADGGLVAGIRQAKCDWLLILQPGARLAEGWIGPVMEHVATSSAAARFSPLRGSGPSMLSRLLGRIRPLAYGLVITKKEAAARAAGDGNAEAVARKVSSRRLSAEISSMPSR